MTTTVVPASVNTVTVTSRDVRTLISIPQEAIGNIVEVLNASDLSVIARAVKSGINWEASFSIPSNLFVIDLTARVIRGGLSSPLTLPTFRIIYDPVVVTVTPSVTDIPILTISGITGVINSMDIPILTISGITGVNS